MNLSHIITEFSFGPYIPDIVQPLDYSYEKTYERESNLWPVVSVTPLFFLQRLRFSSTS